MSEKTIKKLNKLYQRIGLITGRLEKTHAARLNCKRGCSACCIDGIKVFEIEAENIRQNHAELLKTEKPHKKGMCAFLDEQEGACRIYRNRPYVCRTQGLPLRWFDVIEDQTVELRDICPLNEEGEPIEDLPPDKCWTIGEFEARLRQLQNESGRLKRIRLRDLFDKS